MSHNSDKIMTVPFQNKNDFQPTYNARLRFLRYDIEYQKKIQ